MIITKANEMHYPQINSEYLFEGGGWHRLDGPAVIWEDGSQEWHLYGKLHRENGPAIVDQDGNEYYFSNGKLHRLDGPAIIEDGFEEWWINGRGVSDEIIQWAKELNIDLDDLSEDDVILINMKWS